MKKIYCLIGVVVGVIIGALATLMYMHHHSGAMHQGMTHNMADAQTNTQTASSKKEPLYWVAPMDPNYRRDKPGQSPMGMDLVPFYPPETTTQDNSPGTVSISPDVVNNLGVRTVKAEQKPFVTQINTVGYVQFNQDDMVHIHPRVEGWVEQLFVKSVGDPVKKGQPLYRLYSPELVNAQQELLMALKRNNKLLIQAAKERLIALRVGKSFVRQLMQKKQVRRTVTFYAPQAGVIDQLAIRQGFFVKPGTTMMVIGTLDEVWVEAEVFERQAALVKVGLPVTMTVDYLPDEPRQGVVDYIYPVLNAKNRTIRVRLRFPNPDQQLKPNMFVRIGMEIAATKTTLLVPRDAVIRTGQQNRVVLALGKGRFKSVAVELGLVSELFAQIKSGIEVGDRVVVAAQFLLDSESSKTSDFVRLHHGKASETTEAIDEIDHSQMDHSQMDHSQMNHSE